MPVRRWLLVGGVAGAVAVLLLGLAGFAAWPRTSVVDQREVALAADVSPVAGPGELVLVRRSSFFGLRESYTLWAGQQVVVDDRPLTLCGAKFPVANPGDPPVIAGVDRTAEGYQVSFGSGEATTVPDGAMTPCR